MKHRFALSVRNIVLALALVFTMIGLSACTSAADRADENLSKAAENFEVPRRITGINGITDKVLFVVEGFCSYESDSHKIWVICLVDRATGEVNRTTLMRSDNVTMLVTQLQGVNVDLFRPRVIFRPETVVPDFDLSVE